MSRNFEEGGGTYQDANTEHGIHVRKGPCDRITRGVEQGDGECSDEDGSSEPRKPGYGGDQWGDGEGEWDKLRSLANQTLPSTLIAVETLRGTRTSGGRDWIEL